MQWTSYPRKCYHGDNFTNSPWSIIPCSRALCIVYSVDCRDIIIWADLFKHQKEIIRKLNDGAHRHVNHRGIGRIYPVREISWQLWPLPSIVLHLEIEWKNSFDKVAFVGLIWRLEMGLNNKILTSKHLLRVQKWVKGSKSGLLLKIGVNISGQVQTFAEVNKMLTSLNYLFIETDLR